MKNGRKTDLSGTGPLLDFLIGNFHFWNAGRFRPEYDSDEVDRTVNRCGENLNIAFVSFNILGFGATRFIGTPADLAFRSEINMEISSGQNDVSNRQCQNAALSRHRDCITNVRFSNERA